MSLRARSLLPLKHLLAYLFSGFQHGFLSSKQSHTLQACPPSLPLSSGSVPLLPLPPEAIVVRSSSSPSCKSLVSQSQETAQQQPLRRGEEGKTLHSKLKVEKSANFLNSAQFGGKIQFCTIFPISRALYPLPPPPTSILPSQYSANTSRTQQSPSFLNLLYFSFTTFC